MITVLPVKEKEIVKQLFLENGLLFDEKSGVVEAKEKGSTCGYCFYYMGEKSITVEKIIPTDDIFLADGILRSALHVAVCNNINDAFYSDNAPYDLLCKLKFVSDKIEKRLNVNKLFESCCSCADKNT